MKNFWITASICSVSAISHLSLRQSVKILKRQSLVDISLEAIDQTEECLDEAGDNGEGFQQKSMDSEVIASY